MMVYGDLQADGSGEASYAKPEVVCGNHGSAELVWPAASG